jgi:hypothetical protein
MASTAAGRLIHGEAQMARMARQARQPDAARYVTAVVAACARLGAPVSRAAVLEYVCGIATDLADHRHVSQRRVWTAGLMPPAAEVARHICHVIAGQ